MTDQVEDRGTEADQTEGRGAGPGTELDGRTPPDARLRAWVAGFLALLCLAMVVLVVVEVVALRPRYEQVRTAAQDRTDAVRVAQQFTADVNDYDVASSGAYTRRIEPLLTTKFRTDFQQAMKSIVAQVKQTKMSSKGQVLASAVSSLDPDSAEVLVVADADVKTVYGTRARHFRWQVSLDKVGGRWLVDDFRPVD